MIAMLARIPGVSDFSLAPATHQIPNEVDTFSAQIPTIGYVSWDLAMHQGGDRIAAILAAVAIGHAAPPAPKPAHGAEFRCAGDF